MVERAPGCHETHTLLVFCFCPLPCVSSAVRGADDRPCSPILPPRLPTAPGGMPFVLSHDPLATLRAAPTPLRTTPPRSRRLDFRRGARLSSQGPPHRSHGGGRASRPINCIGLWQHGHCGKFPRSVPVLGHSKLASRVASREFQSARPCGHRCARGRAHSIHPSVSFQSFRNFPGCARR